MFELPFFPHANVSSESSIHAPQQIARPVSANSESDCYCAVNTDLKLAAAEPR